MNWMAGIDLGGTQIKSLAWDLDQQAVLETRTDPTRDGEGGSPPPWAVRIAEILSAWRKQWGTAPRSVGLSAPGLPTPDQSGIAFMPGRMAGLEGFNWATFLASDGSLDDAGVVVLNDVQAALMAECWLGAAKACANVVMISLGTGVGGAIRCDGRLLRGAIGRAGHVGHLCLDPDGLPGITRIPGSLEDAIGNSTVERRTNGRFTTTLDLVAAANTGDEEARSVWLTSVRALACGIASLVNIVDPEIVVIGGGIATSGEDLFDPLQAELDKIEWRPGGRAIKLRRAELSEWAGAHGAAYYAATTTGILDPSIGETP